VIGGVQQPLSNATVIPGYFERYGISAADIQALSSLASVVLATVLAWVTWRYARDTRRMVNEMRRQHRPYLYLLWEQDSNGEQVPTVYRLKLKNAGDRVAQDISLRMIQDALVVTLTQDPEAKDWVNYKPVAVPVSSLTICHDGLKSLGPGDVVWLGYSNWYRSATEEQVLGYELDYRDGAGVVYRERLTLGYWICRPPYP
jgi:hypothetical protein